MRPEEPPLRFHGRWRTMRAPDPSNSPASRPNGPCSDKRRVEMNQETPSAEQAVVAIEKRNTEGRQRPYKVLRVLAKVYTIVAPLLAAVMVYNAGVAWYIEEEMMDKVRMSLWFLVQAAMIFLLMKGDRKSTRLNSS